MSQCRNCDSEDLQELGFVGEVAPFFLKRVFNVELRERVSTSSLKQFLRFVARSGRNIFSKLYGQSAFIEMQICKTCSFVQAKHPFSVDAITRLYVDYRSEFYNAERIKYEPSYREIADRVGTDDIEMKVRIDAATSWLADKLETNDDFTILDYGGADGRFLPRLRGKKYVYELSNITPIPEVTRIPNEASLGTYSYVHLAHVLEHVIDPLAFVRRVVRYVKEGGYLYVEVPQEMPDSQLASLKEGTYKFNIPVHEHINEYSLPALTLLMKNAGLELVAIKSGQVDLGWAQSVHLRALGRLVQPREHSVYPARSGFQLPTNPEDD
jgi:hypothetical protein